MSKGTITFEGGDDGAVNVHIDFDPPIDAECDEVFAYCTSKKAFAIERSCRYITTGNTRFAELSPDGARSPSTGIGNGFFMRWRLVATHHKPR